MKHKTQQANDNIGPTPERARMANGFIRRVNFKHKEAGRDRSNEATVLSDGCPLMKLHKRGAISDKQYDAGEKYYAHWYLSGLLPPTTGAYNPAGVGGIERSGMPGTEKQADHRMRYRKASEAIGEQHMGVLSKIVLYNFEPWEYSEDRFGWTNRRTAQGAGTGALINALDALADYYAGKKREKTA